MPSVLITGASRGLGRALVAVYAQKGWTLFPLVRDTVVADKLAAAYSPSCFPIVADVGDEAVVERIAEVLSQKSSSLDLLINNAGHVKKYRRLANTKSEDLADLFNVHCIGAFRCIVAALPYLRKAARPIIVNISSRKGSITRAAAKPSSGVYSYQIAKAAQNMLTACLYQELKTENVRVFGVHPGGLKTDVAPPDADTEPHDAALKLADWIDGIDDSTACRFYDIMASGTIDW